MLLTMMAVVNDTHIVGGRRKPGVSHATEAAALPFLPCPLLNFTILATERTMTRSVDSSERGTTTALGASAPPTRSFFCRISHWAAATVPAVISDPDTSASWNVLALIGTLVLQNSVIAAAEMSGILTGFYDGSVAVAVGFGVAWGIVLLNCERAMIGSVKKGGKAPWWKALLTVASRLGLTLLMAYIVGSQGEQLMSKGRVNLQLAIEHNAESANQRMGTEAKYDNRLADLDSTIAWSVRDMARYDSLANAAFDSAACEGNGSCGSHTNILGPRYKANVVRADYEKLAAEHAHAIDEPRMAAAVAERQEVIREREAEVARFGIVAEGSHDLVARQIALGHIEQQRDVGPIVRRGGRIIMAIAVLIELLALGIKLFADVGPYDLALLALFEGQCRVWEQRKETLEAAAMKDGLRDRAAASAVDKVSAKLMADACAAALKTPGFKKALEDLARDLAESAVDVAKRAKEQAFGADDLARDITESIKERRRQTVDRAADVLGKSRRAVDELDDVATKAETLGADELLDPESPSTQADAAD